MKPSPHSSFRTFPSPQRDPSCPCVVPLHLHHKFKQSQLLCLSFNLPSIIWDGITPGSQNTDASVTVMQAQGEYCAHGIYGFLFFSPQILVVTEHVGTAANDHSVIPSCSIALPFSRCLYFYFAMMTENLSGFFCSAPMFISSGLHPSITHVYLK